MLFVLFVILVVMGRSGEIGESSVMGRNGEQRDRAEYNEGKCYEIAHESSYWSYESRPTFLLISFLSFLSFPPLAISFFSSMSHDSRAAEARVRGIGGRASWVRRIGFFSLVSCL